MEKRFIGLLGFEKALNDFSEKKHVVKNKIIEVMFTYNFTMS